MTTHNTATRDTRAGKRLYARQNFNVRCNLVAQADLIVQIDY